MSHRIRRLCPTALLLLAANLAAGCTTSPHDADQWRSAQAALTLTDSTSTLVLLAAQNCVGSFGELATRPGAGSFDVPGTYTQIIGVAPGFVTHPARFSGTLSSKRLSVSITVPDLGATVGPLLLTPGPAPTWSSCRYP